MTGSPADFLDKIRDSIRDMKRLCIYITDETSFCYTVGNIEDDGNLAEYIVFGVSGQNAYSILMQLSDLQLKNKRPFKHGELVTLAPGAKPVMVIDATHENAKNYAHWVERYYLTKKYRLQQIILPDLEGNYPPNCQEPYKSQFILGTMP